MLKPPPLPSEVLARVQRLATFDGGGLLIIAGSFALISGFLGDYTGGLTGAIAAGAGAIELHGTHLLRARQARGMRWLVGSQLLLLVTIMIYAWTCAMTYDTALITSKLNQLNPRYLSMLQTALENMGASLGEIVEPIRQIVVLGYGMLAVLTLLYQGGMALYYHRRRKTVISYLSSSSKS